MNQNKKNVIAIWGGRSSGSIYEALVKGASYQAIVFKRDSSKNQFNFNSLNSNKGIIYNGLVPHLVLKKNIKLNNTFVPVGRGCDSKELHPAIRLLIDKENTFMTSEFVKVNGGWLA